MTEMYPLLAGATTVGDRIRRLLDDRGISLGDLHRRTGIAKGYLSELVNDAEGGARRKPSAETLYAIGIALGASVADLLGKTRPADEMASWPPGLADDVKAKRPPAEARMLAGISARGRTPTTGEDWRAVHRVIEMYSEG